MDEFEIGACFWAVREGGEGEEDGCIFVDFCRSDSDEQWYLTESDEGAEGWKSIKPSGISS